MAKKQNRRLFVAVPTYGGMCAEFAKCLLKITAEPPVDFKLAFNVGDSLVSRSRNRLSAQFLASDCDAILFLDSDLIFSGEQIARVMKHDELVVGGLYPKKQAGPVQWVMNCLDKPSKRRADGLMEVRYMGTGFLRISRAVFEVMITKWGKDLEFVPDMEPGRKEHDFWSVGVYNHTFGWRRYLSEDWFFCQRCLDLGIKVWADTHVVLKHVGQAIYPLVDYTKGAKRAKAGKK